MGSIQDDSTHGMGGEQNNLKDVFSPLSHVHSSCGCRYGAFNLFEQSALAYIKKGISVFPCVPGNKNPLTTNGYKDASFEDHDIKSWWEDVPNANIGVPTGKVNGFFVVDVDSKVKESFEHLKKLKLPSTYTVSTGNNGLHLYFKHVEGLKNRTGVLPGIDIRADGGYVLGVGSITTAPYELINDIELADAPQNLIDLLTQTQKQSVLQTAVSAGSIPEGGRHTYLTSLSGLLRRKGISYDATLTCVFTENLAKCVPALPDKEVTHIVDSIFRQYNVDGTKTLQANNHTDVENSNEGTDSSVAAANSKGYCSVDELFSEMSAYLNNEDLVKGTPTGFKSFDELLGGGKRLTEITCWHAHAKTGKNAFWHKLMHSWVKQGIPVAYASRELVPSREVLPNLFSIEFQENAWKEKNVDKYKSITDWPLYFANGYGHFPIQDIEVWIKEMKQKGVQHFWFDHLHYMLTDPEEHKEASILIKRLKTLAITENIHIDIIVQPNKLIEGQKLGLATIKGGAAIGQAIDNLIVLEREKEHKNVTRLTLDVARNRQANPGTIWFQYDKETTDFIEIEKETIGHAEVRTVAPVSSQAYWQKNGHRAPPYKTPYMDD